MTSIEEHVTQVHAKNVALKDALEEQKRRIFNHRKDLLSKLKEREEWWVDYELICLMKTSFDQHWPEIDFDGPTRRPR